VHVTVNKYHKMNLFQYDRLMPSSMLQEAGITSVIGSGSALSRNTILQEEFVERFKIETKLGKGGDAAFGAALAVMKNLPSVPE